MADNFFAQFDDPTESDGVQASATDSTPDITAEQMTPRLKAADEAVSRNAHQLQVLPFGSPQYNAALTQARELETEYNAARAEALSGPQPAAQGQPAPENAAPPANPFAVFDNPNVSTHTALDEIGMGLRAGVNGFAQLPDMAAQLGHTLDPTSYIPGLAGPAPKPVVSNYTNSLFDSMGVARPETDREKLYSTMISGATGAMATGGEGAVPMLAAGLSGAGAGGASELARQYGAGPGWQLAAGLAGGLAAPGALAAGGKIASAFTPMAQREISPVMQAFDRQEVPALPADVGGSGTRMATAAFKTTLGGVPIHEGAQASVNATGQAVERTAAKIGNVTDTTGAGFAAQRGATKAMNASEEAGHAAYEAIPIPDERRAVTTNTLQALPEIIRGLPSNPALSRIWASNTRLRDTLAALTPEETAASRAADMAQAQNSLAQAQQVAAMMPTGQAQQALADAKQAYEAQVARAATPIKDGSVSWQDLKGLRTIVGKIIGRPSLADEGPSIDALRGLYGALSRDMKATAANEGTAARVAFNRANSGWAKHEALVKDVITPILGKAMDNSPDEAFKAIKSWVGSNADFIKTARLFKALPQEEADTVRATLFSRLGRAKSGAQNAEGDVFSPAEFVTQWNKLRDNPRVLNLLFPGEQYQKDIDDILTVAGAQKAAQKFNNASQTATALHGTAAAGQLAAGIISTVLGQFTAGAAVIGQLGAQYGAGKLLANPNFARWLASSVKKPNAAAQLAHINRLTALAAKNPAIANDVLSLQEQLAGQFTGSHANPFAGPQPVAAQSNQEGQQKPAQDPYNAFPLVGNADKSQWDKRADGSEKGMGWLGLRQRPDGNVSSEISMDFGHGDIPTMVPGLTPQEANWLLTTPVEQAAHTIPKSIRDKAIAWAKLRSSRGLSPFRQPGEQSPIAAVNQAEGQQ